jgi:hypothetical protein
MARIEGEGLFRGQVGTLDLTQHSGFAYNQLDFGQPAQFNVDLSGYPFLHVLKIPTFLQKLKKDDSYANLINNAIWVLENKFKGLDGIDDITTDTYTIDNGFEQVNLIGKTIRPTASTITMEYDEMTGGLLTKFTELYLEGLQGTRNHYVHYYNKDSDNVAPTIDVSDEIFEFLYYLTDATGINIKKAFIIGLGQFTKVPYSTMYNDKRGDRDKKTISLDLNGVPFTDVDITALAQRHVQVINKLRNDGGKSAYSVPSNINLNKGYIIDGGGIKNTYPGQ